MKKFLAVLLGFIALIIFGCGNEEIKTEEKESFVEKATYLKEEERELKRMNMTEGIIMKNGFFVEEKENIADFLDAWESQDDDFLAQQVIDGKVFHIDKDTRVYYSNDKFNNGKIVKIKFLQGRYKNKLGYTIVKFIREN